MANHSQQARNHSPERIVVHPDQSGKKTFGGVTEKNQ
jgi:hypothetical protein